MREPIISNTVNFHVANIESAISILDIENNKFADFIKIINRNLQYIIYELLVFGECFPLLEINEGKEVECKDIKLQNIDYVVVKRGIYGKSIISIRPDENLRRLIMSGKTSSDDEKISQNIIDCVKRGKNIPINEAYIWHLKLLNSPYNVRGTSYLTPILSYLKDDLCRTYDTEIKNTVLYPFDKLDKVKIKMIRNLYSKIWDQIEPWLNNWFSFISKCNNWYWYKYGVKKPWIPIISFQDVMTSFE
jgi:hypothetical protein